ncbi:MAG TPA: carboxypeptidase-like regulatory domain-containing protein [Pyrinomonadaceae bacterium]|nr:carboxypeptidase-like regulatory domain-containing protein [Pyrinomonadaceae bacterium]
MTTSRRLAHLLTRFGLLLLVLAAFALPALAQNNKGTIVGTVADPNGALVKDARVTVINVATGDTREATTTDDGTYTVPNLEPGQYRVTVDATGFQSVVFEDVKVETNARLPLDVTFSGVAGATGSVTVTAEAAPLVETETSVRGDLITGRQVTELPLPQRNFTLLAALSPGVTRPALGGIGGGGNFESGGPQKGTESTRFRESGGSIISANGARVTNNNFSLDGIDNNESQFGQIAIFPNPDAIQEFKVETSVPSAESGRAGGAIISTTFKSGTNRVHGSVFEYYQGRVAGANPVYSSNPPNYNVHNYGGTVGGPIFLPRFGEGGPSLWDGRNKSFFFFAFNGQRNSTPAFGGPEDPVTIPTEAFRRGDFSALLQPTNIQPFNTIHGVVLAPEGTIFDANGNPFPGNIIPQSQFSPAGFNLLNAYPLPTNTALTRNFARNRKESANINQYDIKIDHNITTNNHLFGRYSKAVNDRIRDNNFPLGSSPNGLDLPSGFGAGNEFGNTRQVALGDTHIFSPTVINDARAGYSRFEIGIFNPGQAGGLGFDPNISAAIGIPGVNVCGIACTGSVLLGVIGTDADKGDLEFIGDASPFFFLSNNYYFGDTLTVVRGNKTLKFGGDFRVRQNQPATSGANAKGQYQYGTQNGGFLSGNYGAIPIGPLDSGSSYANLLLGRPPAHIDRSVPGGPYFQSGHEISFYVQDDWKVNQDLTLNLGLRYDIFTPFTERYDRQLNFVPEQNALIRAGGGVPRGLRNTDKNNFGPRIGFAWSGLREDKTFVIRGGYGLLYTTDAANTGALAVDQPFNGGGSFSCNINQFGAAPCAQIPVGFNLDTTLPLPPNVFIAGPVFPAASITQNVFGVDTNLRDEMYHQLNLTFQWEFRPSWLAEAAYVGNFGRNLLIDRNLGTDLARGPGARVVNLPFVNFTDDLGRLSYNGLQTKLQKRMTAGLSLLTTYAWAHTIDNGPGRFSGNSNPGRDLFGPNNPNNLDLERGNSDLDIRHRFTFASVYDLPFGRGRRYGSDWPGPLNFLLGGFQWNNIITIQSGPPYTINYGEGGARPNLIGDPTPTAEQRARRMEFNPAAFGPPTNPIFPDVICTAAANPAFNGCFGSLGRNTFRGDRQEFWDMSLFKNFRIGENFNIQARMQVFNVLNHVVRNVPERNIEPCFIAGVFDAAKCATNTTDDRFGEHIGIDTSAQRQRQIEWGLRIVW